MMKPVLSKPSKIGEQPNEAQAAFERLLKQYFEVSAHPNTQGVAKAADASVTA